MKKPNFKCKVCGKDYYCCAVGVEKYPYKQIVCSPECYDKWQKQIAARKVKKVVKQVEPVVKTEE